MASDITSNKPKTKVDPLANKASGASTIGDYYSGTTNNNLYSQPGAGASTIGDYYGGVANNGLYYQPGAGISTPDDYAQGIGTSPFGPAGPVGPTNPAPTNPAPTNPAPTNPPPPPTPVDTSASQSAYDALYSEFSKYGLGALVEAVKGLVQTGASGSTLSLALQNTDAYKKRFSANQDRIANGLSALSPAAYVNLEDQYQNVMRQYGLPASYYSKDATGKQAGFDQLISNDVSNVELEDRIATAQNRVLNANPDVLKSLKQFYPDITNGDILAYALDPKTAISALKSKVTGAEIGAAAYGAGLNQGTTPEAISQYAANANLLQQQGVTGAQAQQGMGTVAQYAQRGSQLADIYNQQPYGQTQAQQEVFNLAGQTSATNQRKQLTALEQAQFSGQSGTASNAFSKDRPISPMMLGVPGAGSY